MRCQGAYVFGALLGFCGGLLVAPASSSSSRTRSRWWWQERRWNNVLGVPRSSVWLGQGPAGRRRPTPRAFLLPALRATGGGIASEDAGESVRQHSKEEDDDVGMSGPVVEYETEDGNNAPPPHKVMVLMDCFCPYLGLYVAERIKSSYGGHTHHHVAVVHVLSDYLRQYSLHVDPDHAEQWEAAALPSIDAVETWKSRVGPPGEIEWVGVYVESDSGLNDAEMLRQLLNVTCQDEPAVLPDRRHKHLTNERVHRLAGLPVVHQRLCHSPEEAKAFAIDLWSSSASSRVVVKPYRGCGTESVALCDTVDQVLTAWYDITATKVFGTQDPHTSVLVQECLVGTEYAVDVVARNGHYKVAAVWKYDKRPVNGAPFVYFGTRLVDAASDPHVPAVVDYVTKSLQALGVRWGISHNEVIVTADRGPILVEVNCRQHNMDFAPIAMACLGYNALDALVDAYLEPDPNAWLLSYPDLPVLEAAGAMLHLVNSASGRLRQVHHMEEISNLESVVGLEVYPHFATVGEDIAPTTDIRSDAGWVQLVHDDPAQLQRDYDEVVLRMPTMFEVESPPPI